MRINHARPLDDYMLELTYADGSLRLFDMKPIIAMKPWQVLRSEIFFKQVKADFSSMT